MKKRILAFALAMSMAFSLAMPAAAEAIEPDDSTSVDTELLLDQLEKELQELPTERENDSSSEEVAEDPPATQEPDVLPEEPVPENTPVPTDDEQEGIPAEDEQPEATADPVETPEPTLLPESTAVPEVTEQPETATPETALDEYNADDDIALYIEHSDDQEYMRYLADYYLSNFPYDFYIKGGLKLPYRSDVESKKDNKSWNNTVTAWKVSTLGEGTAALDYTPQKIGYYDTVIFDVIYSVTNEKDFSSKMEKICKATQSGTLKKISKFAWKCKLIDTKTILSDMTDEQMDEFNRFMKDSKSFTNLCEKVGDVTKFFKYCSKVEDFVNKCARAEAILGQMSDTAVVLRQMATETTDMGLKQSLQNMADMCDGTWSEEDIQTFFGGQNATDLLIKEAYSVLWKAVAKECGSLGLAVQVGQAVGKTASNLLFSTDAILENYYSELALYEIEDVLRTVTERNRQAYQNNNSYENARNLNVSVDLMMRLHKQGISQSKEFAKAACEKGLVNKVKLFFNNKQYESYKSSLNNIESQIDFMIHFYDTDVYDLYIEDCGEEIQTDTGNVPEELPCKKEEEPVKRQELKLEAELVSGKTVSNDWTLDKDEEVYADLEITDGAIDLNGHTLTVCGNVIQTGGKLRINGGRLEVGGDYRIQSKGTNDFGDTVWNESNGILVMDDSQDYILVNGTFATTSKREATLNAGTLEIKGDFEQYGTSSSSVFPNMKNFNASGTHKVILTSEEEPRVYFESENSKFQNLEIRNTNTINCDGSFLWVDGSLIVKDKKLAINSDVKLKTMDLAGQNLTVQGYLNKEDGTLLLNGGTVTVKKDANLNSGTTSLANGLMKAEGSVIQTGGQLGINGGRLEVDGDYRIQTRGTNDFGETTWGGSNGTLVMSKPEDYVLVGGTFATAGKEATLTAGTLEVKGNFEQHGTDSRSFMPNCAENFNASGTHKVILSGEKLQTVSFESTSSRFANLEVTNKEPLYLKGTLNIGSSTGSLQSDVTAKADGIKLYDIDLQGHAMNLTGDIYQKGGNIRLGENGILNITGNFYQEDGTLTMNKSTIKVSGNYRIQVKEKNSLGETVWNGSNGILVMSKPEDYVLVGGTFATAGKEATLTAGTLEVKGNFEQHGTDSRSFMPNCAENFNASGTHKVILSGEKLQTVSFESTSSRFANLEVTNKEPLYLKGTLNIGSSTGSLQSDVTAKADGIKLYDIDLQGHAMNLTGDIYQKGGNIRLGENGILNITGNFYQEDGTLTMNKSTVQVTGDYRIQISGKNELDETVWNTGYGSIIMTKPEDHIIVGGTFATSGNESKLTAGTMEIAGDFEQHSNRTDRSFSASGTHKVILNGEGKQNISFDSRNSKFNILELTQARKNYIFEPDECWNTLIEDPVPGPETSPCGTNAKWSLEDGVLTISGRGAIDDYGKAASQPWYASRALITSIVVEEGVTAIGNFNFYGLTNLENVTLARSVTDIGDYAFKNCSGIKELTLPTKLVHIGESAFYGCTGLSQIELPNSLASTGTYVFKNCTGLESAKLSSGMSRVSESLFYGCTKLTNVTIPEGIKTIDGYAFKNCTNLAGAKLPSTLTKLGESAFYGCTKLTDIVIPDGVANIGSYSFKACTGLSSVTLPANLKRIDESAFYGCTALRNIEIPEGTTDIDSYVFKNCTALTNVKLPQSLVQIGESAFYASKLNEVTIPDSVTTIGSYAFKNCASLAEVTLPANLSKIQESAFYGCEKLTTLEIPDKVKSIEGYAFRKCTALQSVQFPAALRQIGESAFYGCTALKQIALPEGVTSIDGYAFKSCTSLKTISLPSTLEKFGDSAFYGCTTVPEIQIPANVREIGGYAFSRCSGLKVVEFVGDAPTIGAAAFSAVTADAYYPDGNTTWTEDKQQDYGGQLTWHSSVDKLHVVAAANALPAA